jgi:hypothetical protein
MKTERRKLAGDHNQCPGCGKFFNSTAAFDKHRTGAYETGRRCLSAKEMTAKGMALNAGNWWVTAVNPGYVRATQ